MKLFENKIGRPSNDTLKKRRAVKALIVASVVLVLGLVSFGVCSLLGISGVSKNVKSTSAAVYISGKNGGFVYKKKYYAAGKTITLGTIEKQPANDNVFFFASDGKTTFNIKGNFGKKFIKYDNGYPKFIVQSYDSSNNVLQTKTTEVKSTAYTLTLTASQNIHHLRIGIIKGGKQVYSQTIKVGTTPTVEHITVSQARKNTAGEFVIEKSAEVKMKFKLTTTSGHTMYYRWFTYIGYTLKSSEVVSTNETCVAFNKTTTTEEYPMNVNRPRAGMIRVYATKEDCKNDTKAKYPSPSSNGKVNVNRSVLKEKVVKYKPAYTTTNSSGFTVIEKYDRKKLSNAIGSQKKYVCFTYALKYGAYILGKDYSSDSDSCGAFGATNHKAKNAAEIYAAIVDNIDRGKPVVIHVYMNEEHPTHWVTVVGYKRNAKGEVNSFDDIWIVDPYSSVDYGVKGDNVLWDGKASDRKNVSLNTLNSSRRYITW